MPSLPYTFANLPAGYSPLSYLDVNFTFLNQRIDVVSITSENLTGTSNSANSIATGTKSFAINELLRAWAPGAYVIIAADANLSGEYMIGSITDYENNILMVDVTVATGGGTFNAWTISLTGVPSEGVPAGGATGQVLAKLSSTSGDVGWADRVQGPGATVTSGNFPAFADSSGNLVEDSGLAGASFATATQGALASGALQKTANLSDVASATTALANIGGFSSAGGTITGSIYISPATAGEALGLNKSGSGYINHLQGLTANSLRWDLYFGDSTAESGGNAGSNWVLNAFSDTGTLLGAALIVTRSTLLMTLAGDPTAALGAATKQYVDAGVATATPLPTTSTNANLLDYPIGSTIFVNGSTADRNSVHDIYLSGTTQFALSGSSQLLGTWQARGTGQFGSGGNAVLFVRTA